MNSAAQDHIISVKGPELCGRQKRSERPREAGLGHRPSHLMRLGVFAYPQLVLTSSPESPRNPSGQRKPSGPGGVMLFWTTSGSGTRRCPTPRPLPWLSTGPPCVLSTWRPVSAGGRSPPQPGGQCLQSTLHVSMVTTFSWEDSQARVCHLLCMPTAPHREGAHRLPLWPKHVSKAPPSQQSCAEPSARVGVALVSVVKTRTGL